MLAGAGRDGVARLWDTENLLRAVLQTLTAIATREPIGTADTLVARVGELDVVAEIPPQAWDGLCWEGSLAGRAAALLEVCGRAVAAAPGGGSFQESRGLARALTGDLAGAAADFKAFVTWAQTHGIDEARIASRREWIAALESGRSPFDDDTLQALRDEVDDRGQPAAR